MTTKKISAISAMQTPAEIQDNPDILRQIHCGLENGQIRTLNLGAEGLYFKRGKKITAFVPLAELWTFEKSLEATSPAA